MEHDNFLYHNLNIYQNEHSVYKSLHLLSSLLQTYVYFGENVVFVMLRCVSSRSINMLYILILESCVLNDEGLKNAVMCLLE